MLLCKYGKLLAQDTVIGGEALGNWVFLYIGLSISAMGTYLILTRVKGVL